MFKHEIKIAPQFFHRVEDGTKTFEVRSNDRGYQPGDIVVMREWDKNRLQPKPDGSQLALKADEDVGYTGRSITKKVGYVYPINSNQVVFSLLEAQL